MGKNKMIKSKEALVSIVIPVYKVEKYIYGCLESVITQSYKNLEIILVDDGSPDKCGIICDKFAKIDQRINVIHKKNGGVSEARNYGIEKARGDYITFVDSDDQIHPEMIKYLVEGLEKSGADISICGYSKVLEPVDEFPKLNLSNDWKVKSGEKVCERMYKKDASLVVVYKKMYKKELWRKLRFPVGKIHEDEFLSYKLFMNSVKIAYSEDKLYYYLKRTGSIMNTKYSNLRLDCFEAIEEQIEYFKERRINNLEKEALKHKFYFCIKGLEEVSENQKDLQKKLKVEYKRTLRQIKRSQLFTKEELVWYFEPKSNRLCNILYWKIRKLR
jgi:glycosyltransferase involved in cell wall biosynthesis